MGMKSGSLSPLLTVPYSLKLVRFIETATPSIELPPR